MNKYIKTKDHHITFETKDDLFSYLRKNKDLLIMEKKASLKEADGFACCYLKTLPDDKIEVVKSFKDAATITETYTEVKIAVNATNIIDSYLDLHIPKMWNRSLKNNKLRYHLQEHKREYEKIIAYPDYIKAYVQTMSFKELGFDYNMLSEVLIYQSKMFPSDNAYMIDKYKQGKVKNHSVGMLYVTIELCMNSDNRYDKAEKDNWEKYYPMAVNPEVADEYGYFWAVLEAKELEGSAVPFGACPTTPTIEISESKGLAEGTPLESSKDTLTADDIREIFKELRN